MIILNNGNVGIGTTNPVVKVSCKLLIIAQSTSALTICNELNGGDGFLISKMAICFKALQPLDQI